MKLNPAVTFLGYLNNVKEVDVYILPDSIEGYMTKEEERAYLLTEKE